MGKWRGRRVREEGKQGKMKQKKGVLVKGTVKDEHLISGLRELTRKKGEG